MRIIIIILLLIGFSTSVSQIYMSTSGFMSYSSRTQIDSIFVNYESPNLPDSLFSFNWSEINIICDIGTNPYGKVSEIDTYPLNKTDIYIEPDSHMWEQIADSVESISKKWIFKTPFWITEGLEPDLKKETFEKYNKNPVLRPFSGQPRYIIILSICNECHFNNHQFYHHINDYENK